MASGVWLPRVISTYGHALPIFLMPSQMLSFKALTMATTTPTNGMRSKAATEVRDAAHTISKLLAPKAVMAL